MALALGIDFGRKITITATEPIPAGTEIVIVPICMNSKNRVRLSIQAPRSLVIMREDAVNQSAPAEADAPKLGG